MVPEITRGASTMSILEACKPRQDILAGTFNPEIFTASLSEVIRYYKAESTGIHPLYTDARLFFSEATYPTRGMKTVLSEVFSRIAGDSSVPAIHRLETAFGGGKTHTLIACTHIAYKGKELAGVTDDIIDSTLLPDPGTVKVIGIAGDEIPVHKPMGARLIPYTLWGEIAYQLGGENLYQQVEQDAASYAAPGRHYFDTVFMNQKVVIMLDELAQYAARLVAIKPDGADQLAAFLMSLHGYARTHEGIAVILTLASSTDAFANQTERLARLISQVTGQKVSRDDALGVGQEALKGVTSVVARDASTVVPVQAAEISLVLSKRLFTSINKGTAKETANTYAALYARHASLLPDQATKVDYKDRIISYYPFHPTLIDYLNNKLSTAEDFQGTRGVLRVLTLAIRSIWQNKLAIPMMHACHLDLRLDKIVNELIGRTGSGDLLPVLNADIGGVDTEGLEGGKSNAELADSKNPHPEGWPMYELVWKTVFLHSLVGRAQGLGSNIFGLTEQDALLNTTFPGLTPPQILEALKEISNSAYYLRHEQGRYYASLEPSINIALARIRSTLKGPEPDQLLEIFARKVVSGEIRTFTVCHDVSAPEHIPDKGGKPVLALVSLSAGRIDPAECVTKAGSNTPRVEQNLVFLLAPDTVGVHHEGQQDDSLFGSSMSSSTEVYDKLRELARWVLAIRKLKSQPYDYGINPKMLDQESFKQRSTEREKALETAVTRVYKSLWFPSTTGQIIRKEIRTGGGESGASIIEQIHKVLLDEGELVTAQHNTLAHLQSLRKLFFSKSETISIPKIKENFCCIRTWPILEQPALLAELVRSGVDRGVWCVFRMKNTESTMPDEFFSRDTGGIPFHIDLSSEYSLVTPEGARKRGWGKDAGPDIGTVKDWIRQIMGEAPAITVSGLKEKIVEKHGDVASNTIFDSVVQFVQDSKLMTYKGRVDQEETPANIISGADAMFFHPEGKDVLITRAHASEKGWLVKGARGIDLEGKNGAKVLLPLLRRIGSLYARGGASTVNTLDLTDLTLTKGGSLRITLTNVPPESLKTLGELFEVIDGIITKDERAEAYLTIDDPKDKCPFVQEVQKGLKEK